MKHICICEVPVLKIWVEWITFPYPLLPGPLWPGGVIRVWVPSKGQIDLVKIIRIHLDCVQTKNLKNNFAKM